MTKPWNMAKVASRRELPKPRKMHGPVGQKLPAPTALTALLVAGTIEHNSCDDCGHHVCSCEELALKRVKAELAKWAEIKGGPCPCCDRRPRLVGITPAQGVAEGFEYDVFADVFIKLCALCEQHRPYSWVKDLDPKRVLEWRKTHKTHAVDDLRILLPGRSGAMGQRQCEHGKLTCSACKTVNGGSIQRL